jgi:hypothetical protein
MPTNFDQRNKPSPTGIWVRIKTADHNGTIVGDWFYSANRDRWLNTTLPYGQICEFK